ncbi:MAG TPA: hypothetical protein ENG45_00490 [Candidatus Aenigmarchaeota archaeon]|nr:hypothetical protein [Candidatus Aenigmarchaeota archaeon]
MIRKAVVLAAGIGKRLRPITYTVPKVMVRINKKPIVEYVIEKLKKVGIDEIALVVGYKKDVIKNFFGDSFVYIEQKEQLGTAHAIKVAKDFVKDENFVAINGDIFFEDDLTEFVKMKPITMGVFRVSDASTYGRVIIKDDRVVDIVEKDGIHAPGVVNTGIYIFDKRIFDAIEKTRLSPRGEYEITDSIKILIREGVEVKPYFLKGYWKDVGRVCDLEEVRNAISLIH